MIKVTFLHATLVLTSKSRLIFAAQISERKGIVF